MFKSKTLIVLVFFVKLLSAYDYKNDPQFGRCKPSEIREESMNGNFRSGIREFHGACKECHVLENKKISSMSHTMAEWWELFKNNSELIREKHNKTSAEQYFRSEQFNHKYRDLYEYLHDAACDHPNWGPPTG
jgi:hypothetical protein